jgi:hypothetical protein
MKKSVIAANIIFIILVIIIFNTRHLKSQQESKVFDNSKTEEWSYTLLIKSKGTRSESWKGILMKDQEPISAENIADIVETPMGKFKWFGESKPDDVPFTNRGWLNNLPRGKKVFDESEN